MGIQTSQMDPRRAYLGQKASSKGRGIAFELTFEEWWEIWREHWPRRCTDSLVMCRTGDQGPYAVGNVRIATIAENNAEAAPYRIKPGKYLTAPSLEGGLTETVEEHERAMIVAALHKTRWNKTAAAKLLLISYRALRYRVAKLGLEIE